MESEHHHEHIHQINSLNSVFIISIVLNLLFVIIEAGVGLFESSLSLLSDAGHNLSDVFSLVLVLIAFRLAKMHSSKSFTYGLKKSSILISLLNAIILLVAVGAIIIESIHKFYEPTPINGTAVSITAGVGIIINGATAMLLMKGQKNDLNVRGAFLHMAADTLVSVGVVVSGIIINSTGWNVIDPIVSLFIAIIILVSTWKLLSESVKLSVDGTPNGINIDELTEMIDSEEHVCSVHHIHVWAMSTTENAMTAHVVIDDINNMEEVKHELKEKLKEHKIIHTTLEMETTGCKCHDMNCEE